MQLVFTSFLLQGANVHLELAQRSLSICFARVNLPSKTIPPMWDRSEWLRSIRRLWLRTSPLRTRASSIPTKSDIRRRMALIGFRSMRTKPTYTYLLVLLVGNKRVCKVLSAMVGQPFRVDVAADGEDLIMRSSKLVFKSRRDHRCTGMWRGSRIKFLLFSRLVHTL